MFIPPELELDVTALPDEYALLYGSVPAETRSVEVRRAGGETTRVVPMHSAFAVALGPEEFVGEIVLDLPSGPIRCPFDEDFVGYSCGDPSASGSIDGGVGHDEGGSGAP